VIDIGPQPGPQYQLAATEADLAIFGGAAGPGKSWALVYDPLRWVKVKGFSGIIFRRTTKQLRGGGSVWEESQKLYPYMGGKPREGAQLDWKFPSGAVIEFNHLQHEKDKYSHKSKQYCYIGLDEATDFTEGQFWYLLSRNRSTCGVKPYVRAATNPDPDSHIRKLIDWYIGPDGFPIAKRSGVLRYFFRYKDDLHWADTRAELDRQFKHLPAKEYAPKSFTFIPAKLEDNKILAEKDPGYRANLLAMHELDRAMLLGGNWNVRPVAGDYFKRDRVNFVDTPPSDLVEVSRGWDKAASKPSPSNPDPDYTVGVKMGRDKQGREYILDVRRDRLDPLEVERLILSTAEADGHKCKIALWQDPAQAGKFDVAHFVRLLSGYVVEPYLANQKKEIFAKPFSSQWLAGNVTLVRGPWNDAYLNELEAFPSSSDNVKDDQVDASSVAHILISEGLSGLAALEALTKM
jgi:predicted phage terminase large subunit-like protein